MRKILGGDGRSPLDPMHELLSLSPAVLASAALSAAAVVAVATPAFADGIPLRVAYVAHDGCPSAAAFAAEIRQRTTRARPADPGEAALEAWVNIQPDGGGSSGGVLLRGPQGDRRRSVHGGTCDEVVSALALITALAVDPEALSQGVRREELPARSPSAFPPATPEPTAPSDLVREDPRPPLRSLRPPPAPSPWFFGPVADVSIGLTPTVLLGGGVFAERRLPSMGGAILRIEASGATTGWFPAGPAQARFVRGMVALTGCAFAWAPFESLVAMPCLGVEGGVLEGQGSTSLKILKANEELVPWAALHLGPRIAGDFGALFVALEARVVISPIERTFEFTDPEFVIDKVPQVTGAASLSLGLRIP